MPRCQAASYRLIFTSSTLCLALNRGSKEMCDFFGGVIDIGKIRPEHGERVRLWANTKDLEAKKWHPDVF